jgi:hypothetical protein
MSLELAKSMFKPTGVPQDFYVYWIGRNINYKHKVLLKSYLATQDLSSTKLFVYSDTIIADLFPEFAGISNIEFKLFDVFKECENTMMYAYRFKNEIKTHAANPEFESDFFRLLMLHKYGGIYLDFDVLLLRDFSPLNRYEYCYQWGSENTMMNGAVMSMHKNSQLTKDICEEMVNSSFSPGKGCLQYANNMYVAMKPKHPELVIFPGAFFNPQWQYGRDAAGNVLNTNPVSKDGNLNMYEGSFAWHYHGTAMNAAIDNGSKFDIIDRWLDAVLKEKIGSELCKR